jgi:hypothetical protein
MQARSAAPRGTSPVSSANANTALPSIFESMTGSTMRSMMPSSSDDIRPYASGTCPCATASSRCAVATA